MKKKSVIIVCWMWVGITLTFAQTANYSREYGKVTAYELGMTGYPEDNDAEAVVLYEIGSYYFSKNEGRGRLDLVMEIRTKIKIFNQAGIKYGEFELPYYADNEVELIEIEATTYNVEPGGIKKTKLEKKNIFEEKPHTNWRVKKFAMPDVKEGSVIELKYTITTPYFVNMREWEYQKKIPVIYSLLTYRAIPYYEYTYILKGANKFDEYKAVELSHTHYFGRLQYKEMEYTFGMKNIPAFRDEEFITSANDYKMSLNLQLCKIYYPSGGSSLYMSTWPEIADKLLKDDSFGKYIKSAEKEGKKILPSLGLADRSDKKCIKKITRYVKKNYNWNGFNGKFTSLKVPDFMKQKTGSSAEINLFLLGLLRAAGIKADPVAVSTRKHGVVMKDYPFEKFLNYVIVQAHAEDISFLLDATEPMLEFEQLPERCIHVNGLIIKPKSNDWIFTSQKEIALTERSFRIEVKEEKEQLLVSTDITSHNYDGYKYRSIYRGEKDNLVSWLKEKDIQLFGEIRIENYGEIDKPFVFSFESEYPLEKTDQKLFIHPFLNQSVTENIFKQNNRMFPVDLILFQSSSYKSSIEIPEGYEIEYLPKSQTYDNPRIYINYQISQSGNTISVEASYYFKKNLYDANEYGILKAFFDEMVNKFNERIVLVKKI
ncbi:MAG: DUF3857 domain-containing protein [Candidatus Azobacteroides sp.]|nr:DUF3857 domain-containing protein [Candidatus Azobacteroides sp.]